MLITPDFSPSIDPRRALDEAVSLAQQGRLAQACGVLEAAVAQHPEDAELWGTLARVRRRSRDLAGSAQAMEQAFRLMPDNADIAAELALTYIASGEPTRALTPAQVVEDRTPSRPVMAVKLAQSLVAMEETFRAEQVLRRCLMTHPRHVGTLATLGRLLVTLGRLDEAEAPLRLAVRFRPERLDAHLALGTLYVQQGAFEAAAEHFDKSVQIDPANPAALSGVALVHERMGRLDDCLSLLRSHPELLRNEPQAVNSFAQAAKQSGQAKEALPWVQRMLETELTPQTRSHLLYSLGMLQDALKNPEAAAGAWTAAGQARDVAYHPATFTHFVDRTIATFTVEAFESLPRAEVDNTDIPLLVVGFPRSGTSLVEQILASHPEVHGGGERPWLERIATRLERLPGIDVGYPEAVPRLPGHQLDNLAQTYMDLLTGLDAEARYIVDKLTQNLHYLGLAAALLPQARVVWCVRDPRDAVLSAWAMNFNDAFGWSTRADWAAQRWIDELRLANHWVETLPLAMHTVVYEELLADPDEQIRQLLDFAELPWNPDCRDFHRTERFTNTASYAQVRRPLYKTSAGRFARYAEFLPEVEAMLAPWVDIALPRR